MQITSDINILGSLPDWNLIRVFLTESSKSFVEKGGSHGFTAIKTERSIKRFEKAIRNTFLTSDHPGIKQLTFDVLNNSGINPESNIFLFWVASGNNDLLCHLNNHVFFPAYYSGRVAIRNDEVQACLNELKQSEPHLNEWSDLTISTTASKYLTLLKKFGIMEGGAKKSIVHPNLSDPLFVLFIYWLVAISGKTNLLHSEWLPYGFSGQQVITERLLQKKFNRYFNIAFTGDKLSIEPIFPYESIYEHLYKS